MFKPISEWIIFTLVKDSTIAKYLECINTFIQILKYTPLRFQTVATEKKVFRPNSVSVLRKDNV